MKLSNAERLAAAEAYQFLERYMYAVNDPCSPGWSKMLDEYERQNPGKPTTLAGLLRKNWEEAAMRTLNEWAKEVRNGKG